MREMLFIGDAGTTAASRPSHRFGIEWTNYLKPRPWITLEADIALSRARVTDGDPAGNSVPGAVETVASMSVAVDELRRVFGGARLRHFGPGPLVENNVVRSKATTLLNLQGGYAIKPGRRAVLDVFNVFDAKQSDVDYLYVSHLPQEPAAGVEDVHFHPTPPRSARFGIQLRF